MPLAPVQIAAAYEMFKALDIEVKSRVPIGRPDKMPHTSLSQDLISLRRAPVWLASVDKKPVEDLTSRSHSFVVVGDPGQGARSGAAYFSISGDENRTSMKVSPSFLKNAANVLPQTGKGNLLSPIALAALKTLQERTYATQEAFFMDYQHARRATEPSVKLEQLVAEGVVLSSKAVPYLREMWQREPNGRDAQNPNLAERDVRMFENIKGREDFLRKDFKQLSDAEKLSGNAMDFDDISLRRQMTADPMLLLEAKQQVKLHCQYMDELHGRDGSTIPAGRDTQGNPVLGLESQHVTPDRLRAAIAHTPHYQWSGPFDRKTGNCSTGAATMLRIANVQEKDIKTPSNFAGGLHHTMQAPYARPLPSAPTPSQSEQVDGRSIREGVTDVSAINEVLRRRMAVFESPIRSRL